MSVHLLQETCRPRNHRTQVDVIPPKMSYNRRALVCSLTVIGLDCGLAHTCRKHCRVIDQWLGAAGSASRTVTDLRTVDVAGRRCSVRMPIAVSAADRLMLYVR